MSMVYINVGGSLKLTSIYKKIMGQIEGMNQNGLSCQGYFLSTHIQEITPLNNDIQFYPIQKPEGNLFFQLKLKKHYLNAIQSILDQTEAEFIYLRYSFASKRLLRMIKQSGKKFIIERNSKSIDEIIALCRQEKASLRISYLLGKLQDCLIPYINEKLYSRKISSSVYLTVGVTQELANHYQPKPSKRICIPNGISIGMYPLRNGPPFKRGEKCIILVMDGTSTPTPWQGLDRLIKSIYDYNLTDKVEIRIAGAIQEVYSDDFVKQLGFLDGPGLEVAVNDAHLGTGNLCLFRKNLSEGAVLKNREYAIRGLPILYAMDDLDFDQTSLSEFALKISNTNDTIDLPSVLDWLEKLYSEHPNLSIDMNKSAARVLSFRTKMKKLKDYILCQQKRTG